METPNEARSPHWDGRVGEDGAFWALATLLTEYTLRLDVRTVRRLSARTGVLPAGTRVAVRLRRPCPLEEAADAVGKLVGNGLRPVMGLPAEWLDGDRLTDRVLRTLTDVGVRDVQLRQSGSGALETTLSSALGALVASPVLRESFESVGLPVTLHAALEPESVRVLGLHQAMDAMAAEHSIDTYYLADQPGSARAILDLERRLRRAGSRMGLRATLATGRSGQAVLLAAGLGRRAESCPAGEGLSTPAPPSPEEPVQRTLIDLADAMEGDPDCLLDRVHLLPGRDILATVEWAEALAGGRFFLDDAGGERRVVLCPRPKRHQAGRLRGRA